MGGVVSEQASESDVPRGPWIPVERGFLCDPRAEDGRVEVRDGVAYWMSALGGEHVLDLTDEARAEADRRNRMRLGYPPAMTGGDR